MLISQIYERVRSFAILSLNNPLINVVFANQGDTRALKPMVTIAIGNLSQVDNEIRRDIDIEGVQDVLLQKSFIVTFNSYSDTLHDSENILNFLENGLFTEQAYMHFNGDIAAVKTVLGVTSLPKDVSAKMESRAILEVEFRVNQNVASNVGLIEHVQIHDAINNEDIIINR